MIFFGSTDSDQTFQAFEGADGGSSDSDYVVSFQGNDPIVLENRINAEGQRQSAALGRSLAGIQIAGGGKGNDFVVTMLFGRTGAGSPTNFPQNDTTTAGLNVFLFKGSSEAELNQRKQDALTRALAFCSGFGTPYEWRGCEMAGANDGPEFMGMFIVYHGTPA
jgi:hypothetical protein